MIKKHVFYILLLTAALSLSACGNKDTDQKGDELVDDAGTLGDDVANDVEDVTKDIMTGFRDLLSSATNSEDIYKYIDDNSTGREPEEVDEMVMGVLGYGDDINNVDFKRLSAHTAYMSDEMNAFVTFMAEEQENPAVNSEGMQAELKDCLEKCYQMEQHMDLYPEGNTYQYVFDKYCEYMKAAITGGYTDKVEEYAAFVEEHPDSKTAAIVSDYLKVLLDNNSEVNEAVQDYYDKIQEKFTFYLLENNTVSEDAGNVAQ